MSVYAKRTSVLRQSISYAAEKVLQHWDLMTLCNFNGLEDLPAVEGDVHAVGDVNPDPGNKARIKNPDGRSAPDVEVVTNVVLQSKVEKYLSSLTADQNARAFVPGIFFWGGGANLMLESRA
jgi:hypothetical protein